MAILKDIRKELDQLDDIEIIRNILEKGERELLAVLYDRYASKVFYKCLRVVGDRPTAQDLTHDVMVKIFLNLPAFRGKSNFSFWVHSITHNHCMDYFNKKKQIHFEDFDPSDFCHLTEEVEQESQILADLRLSQLENFMKELKQGDKLILLMRYQDSMSMKEISQTLKISEGAVKMRLRRSVYRLAELLKKAHDNE